MQNRSRRALVLLALFSLCLSQTGCNVVLMLGYLIGGPPSIEPDFHAQTKETLAGRNKTTLVYVYAPTELKWDHDAVDYELAKFLSHRLNANKIRVIDPDRVHAWLDKNRDWNKVSEIGAAFKVDYIVFVDLQDYSLFEEHSHELFRGRADGIVSVFKMNEDKKDGESIYTKELVSRFPTGSPISAFGNYSYETFKQLYLATLANTIGKLFYESFTGDDIPETAL